VLVIGGGFLGSNVALALADSGFEPHLVARSEPPAEVRERIGRRNIFVGDASDAAVIGTAMTAVAHVVVCAGGLLPAAAERDPDADEAATLGLLGAVIGAVLTQPGARLLFMSSGGTVYGQPQRLPVTESHPTGPLGAYGRTRVACELLLAEQRARHGLLTCSLRCANAYGQHQLPDRGQGAVATFMQHMRNGTPIEIFGDGATVRDYVYAADIARATIALLNTADLPETVNVGSGRGTSLSELVDLVAREVGREPEIIRRPARAFDVSAIVLDIDLLTRIVGQPPTPLEEGLRHTHRWLAASASAEPATVAPSTTRDVDGP
jgi:UDP-glucose 4-epimerase